MRVRAIAILLSALSFLCAPVGVRAADGQLWHVSRSSGDVWVMRGPTQLVAIEADTTLSPGDNIRTGRNGRVLLTRGEERIVISPNAEIGIPTESKDGYPTTIAQRAGSILLDVEKRNVQHFEVETPYLAAVVKGTQFRVTVDRKGAHVEVTRGQVQVADFKSGQNVLILPGQGAAVSAHGASGLKLTGSGTFNPIQHGAPRPGGLRALWVPKGGLRMPNVASRDAKHGAGVKAFARVSPPVEGHPIIRRGPNGSIHIGAALGEVKLDFKKATNGLAHGIGPSASPSHRNMRDRYDSASKTGDGTTNGSDGSGAASNSGASVGAGSNVAASSGPAAPGGIGGGSGAGGPIGGGPGAAPGPGLGPAGGPPAGPAAGPAPAGPIAGPVASVLGAVVTPLSPGCGHGNGKKVGLSC